jgi:alpha-L-arabinofuranosidase
MSKFSHCAIAVGVILATASSLFADEPPAAPTLKITNERICRGTISPYQYGQFIEYLCALTPSMFSEKLFDGSFEGVPPYGFEFRKETDRMEQPWYPDGATNRGEYVLDPAGAFNGKVSQRIRQKPGDPATLGVSQSGMYVKAGEPLRLSAHLRANDVQGPVKATIWGEGKVYATAELSPIGNDWKRLEATLTPSGTDTHATLTLSFRGPGTLWIDQVSLMPTKNVFGWRTDVAEALKALKPGIIRFGGSTIEGFDWRATIGDADKRVPFTTCWGGLEPANAGLEEFVRLCEWVGAEPLICIRFTDRTPKDGADEVEYFNGPANSPMGKLRAANGHAAPYMVKYWQIGNELGDEKYQKGVAAFCKAMKAVDPSIKLMAAFPSPGLLKNAGQYLDYICPHHYDCTDIAGTEANIVELRKMIAENAPGRDIRLGVTEWNTTAGDRGLDRARLWTLDNALRCSRYHNLIHRHCDLVEIANRSNLADSFCSGIIQPNNHTFFKTPTYYAQELYATRAGRYPLKVQFPGAAADPELDVSATLAEDGNRLAIFVVNTSLESYTRTLDLTPFLPLAAEAECWTLADSAKAGERDAFNSWREPDRIRPESSKTDAVDGSLMHKFPPLSLTVFEFRRKAGQQ